MKFLSLLIMAIPKYKFNPDSLSFDKIRLGVKEIILRSLDAIHLATCEQLAAFPLYTADARMRQAATKLNIHLGSQSPS